jgi:hypothetical protein
MVTLTSKPRTRHAAFALASLASLLVATAGRAEDTVAIPVPAAPSAIPAPTTTAGAPAATPPGTANAAPNVSRVDARVHHVAPSSATAHEALRIQADIEDPHLAKEIVLAYRVDDGAFKTVPFLLANEHWIAEIPAEDMLAPSVSYTIEVVRHDGTRTSVFATREAPFRIGVAEDLTDTREGAWLNRVGGKRSEVTASADYVSFGNTDRTSTLPSTTPGGTPVTTTSAVRDAYFRTEARYTYRPLIAVIDFGVRIGIVRGNSPRPIPETESVGLNYGAAHGTFAIIDGLAVTVEALTSVTEVGFSGGGGVHVHIGDYFGEKLVIGVESIKTFGTRGYVRLDLARNDAWRVSPMIEVTDMPHAQHTGLRLIVEAAGKLGAGFALVGRVSYQARDFHSGGPGAGLGLSYSF